MAKSLKAGALYFIIVFGVGFVLGTIRTLWIVPRLGVRWAELLEAPLMVAVSFLAARWIVIRIQMPSAIQHRLGMGLTGLVLLLVAEFGFVLWLRGLSLRQYSATRDPVSGAVYCLSLLLFAVAPTLVNHKASGQY